MLEKIAQTNAAINTFIWGPGMCVIFVAIGIYFSVGTRFFQISKFKMWWRGTIVALFKDKNVTETKDKKSISQFQALTTALAATIGTGNIVGVSTALVSGGAGAVFWMWVSAFFGMMTKYAEIILSMKYRYKDLDGRWNGGPMVFIEKGLGVRWLAVLFAFFCIFASFGMGNMSQANSMAGAINSTFGIETLHIGIVTAICTALVMMGGIKRIGRVTELTVPVMAFLYVVGGVIIIAMNYKNIPSAFVQIFEGAFSAASVGGGIAGYTISKAMRFGVARGVFSNEAGLGSSSIAHSASDTKEPVKQAMWGIFEVFVDTIVVCSITALVILTTGVLGATDGNGEIITGAGLTILAFSKGFGSFAGGFISVGISMFAFATLLGWSYYGERCVEYLFGLQYTFLYKMLFVIAIIVGCVSSLDLVWEISDTFNGLMAMPNLTAIILLSKEVFDATKRYVKNNRY